MLAGSCHGVGAGNEETHREVDGSNQFGSRTIPNRFRGSLLP